MECVAVLRAAALQTARDAATRLKPVLRPAEALAADRDRWALWLPVGLGMGIALYFSLPHEPPWWSGGAALAAALLVGGLGAGCADARRTVALLAALALGAMALGFTAAQVRTAWVAAPVVGERLGPVTVEGRVGRVEPRSDALRVTLVRPTVGRLAASAMPERVRLSLRGRQPAVRPGDHIRLRAMLMPPPEPSAPGAFDFQRRSYFERLGAVGYALGAATVTAAAHAGDAGFATAVDRQRLAIAARIRRHLDGDTGVVATALMNGERGAISAPVLAAIRDAGLVHLLAISGLHIGLVAGVLFVGMRAGLALAAPLTLRLPTKKIAAVVALAGAGAYTVLAGATVPSQRAFLMIGLVLLAVLVDRRGLSMRLVAWAAAAILLLTPESLLTASFQLSFAAVTALIAVYETVRLPAGRGAEAPTLPQRALFYLAGVALTTLVAGLATAPFAVYHFSRFAEYSLAANLLAVPVTALWVMPWAVVAFCLMPFGLAGLALAPMGWGIDVVIAVAKMVAAWPGAVVTLPAASPLGLAVVVVGGLWLCLWRQPWRLWGGIPVAVGLLLMLTAAPPDVLVDADGKLVAVRGADGGLLVSSRRAARFARQTWSRRNGDDRMTAWPEGGVSGDGRLACDRAGCLLHAGGHQVALVRRPEALAEDCHVADVVVSVVPVRRPCPAAAVVVDRFDLWREGAHAVWLGDDGVRVESVSGRRGDRPWVVRARNREQHRPAAARTADRQTLPHRVAADGG